MPSVPDRCTRQSFFSFFLPSVLDLSTRQSFFFIFFLLLLFQKKDFISLPSVKKNTWQTPSLPSVFFTLGKLPLYRVFFLPSVFRAALGKELVCRVSNRIHSANIKTLDKFDVSGSGVCIYYAQPNNTLNIIQFFCNYLVLGAIDMTIQIDPLLYLVFWWLMMYFVTNMTIEFWCIIIYVVNMIIIQFWLFICVECSILMFDVSLCDFFIKLMVMWMDTYR